MFPGPVFAAHTMSDCSVTSNGRGHEALGRPSPRDGGALVLPLGRWGTPITVRRWFESALPATLVSCAVGTVGLIVIILLRIW
jgi:hypothetical protein